MGSPWQALADDGRRRILLLLKEGEKTPTEIAKHFDFTMAALSAHLRILKEAGLVTQRRAGRNRLYSLNAGAMMDMVRFFDTFQQNQLNENSNRHQ